MLPWAHLVQRNSVYCSSTPAVSHLNSTGAQRADTLVNSGCQPESAASVGSDRRGTATADEAQHGAKVTSSSLHPEEACYFTASDFCLCVCALASSRLSMMRIGRRETSNNEGPLNRWCLFLLVRSHSNCSAYHNLKRVKQHFSNYCLLPSWPLHKIWYITLREHLYRLWWFAR